MITSLLDTVQGIDPLVRTLLAALSVMLETSVLVGLVVPGDTIVVVAGTAVSSWPEGMALGVAVVAGSLAGESIGFALGRLLGPRIRASRVGRLIGEANWQRAEGYLVRRGGPAVFLSRFLPVLHSLVPLTVGMSGFPYRRFLALTLPACVLWAGLYISVASVAAGTFRELADTISYAGYLFVAVIAAFLLIVVLAKKVIARVERRHLVGDAWAGTGATDEEHPTSRAPEGVRLESPGSATRTSGSCAPGRAGEDGPGGRASRGTGSHARPEPSISPR